MILIVEGNFKAKDARYELWIFAFTNGISLGTFLFLLYLELPVDLVLLHRQTETRWRKALNIRCSEGSRIFLVRSGSSIRSILGVVAAQGRMWFHTQNARPWINSHCIKQMPESLLRGMVRLFGPFATGQRATLMSHLVRSCVQTVQPNSSRI